MNSFAVLDVESADSDLEKLRILPHFLRLHRWGCHTTAHWPNPGAERRFQSFWALLKLSDEKKKGANTSQVLKHEVLHWQSYSTCNDSMTFIDLDLPAKKKKKKKKKKNRFKIKNQLQKGRYFAFQTRNEPKNWSHSHNESFIFFCLPTVGTSQKNGRTAWLAWSLSSSGQSWSHNDNAGSEVEQKLQPFGVGFWMFVIGKSLPESCYKFFC